VKGACQLLGLDPLNVANEGKALIVCPANQCDTILPLLQAHPFARDAHILGTVHETPVDTVLLETLIGGERFVDIPDGEMLPRIC